MSPQTDEVRPVCALCTLPIYVPDKAHRTEDDDTTLWYHDSYADDCWRKEINKRMGRAERS